MLIVMAIFQLKLWFTERANTLHSMVSTGSGRSITLTEQISYTEGKDAKTEEAGPEEAQYVEYKRRD